MIYLCLQPNPFRYRLWLQNLKRRLDPDMADFNFLRLDGATVTAAAVGDAAAVMPMMSDVRIVEVGGLLDRLRAILQRGEARRKEQARGECTALLTILRDLPVETILVLMEPESSRSKDWRSRFGTLDKQDREFLADLKAREALAVVSLDTPEQADLIQWMERRGAEKGLTCNPDALWALGQRVGHDLQLLDLEMDKLAAYADGASLTAPEVEELVADYREEPIWQLADAVFSQAQGKAMRSLAHLEAQGFTPYHILGTLSTQLRLLAAVKMGNASDEVIASALKVHPYAIQKARRKAHRFSRDRILYLCDLLQEADYAMKSRSHPEQILEALIGRLLMPALWESA